MRVWSAEQTRIENGTWHEQTPKSVTFERALKLYREYSTVQNRSHRSYVEPALSVWEAHIKPSTLLAKVTTALVEDVKLRRAQAVAHATVDKDLAVLKAFFSWCMARNLAASNPMSRVKFFNEDNSRLRYLTEDEYNRLIKAAKTIESPRLAEKILLSVHTGLRRGSLFHLRWDNVDFLNRRVRIPRTKSGRPHAIPLNATVVTTLQALFTERVPDCPYVFAHTAGRNAGQPVKDVKNGFHTALEIAEIKDFTWHDLRHTFASWLIMKGASLRSVAELLGHRGLRMVMRYAHLSPAYLSSEVALLDAATRMPPLPEETRGGKRARKGQRAPRRDQAQAKVVKFPNENGSPSWTSFATFFSEQPDVRRVSGTSFGTGCLLQLDAQPI
jgi:integrase